ncbi:16S rRNA (uracil(1498)-N(3))-methyltransferase [Albibacterium bauzanense]|uniref:Ribosomal RNA small subunit methyltransferase E n=1 Tax=Albibacterium bauzanense TaxID=653929 RepID=A0A4R1LVE0_9SPHI|nr:16S rRNA (uracil(1498)-N(3))-methyltransferase [Albibacterium bauzanense]TCK82822.1 16S rRNA (uracil1498-N3)-methyltransferase [Albibacterium bauzanense]
MHIFYTPDIENQCLYYDLSEEESKHCTRVLRLKAGANITLIDGNGGIYTGKIADSVNKKRTRVDILSFVRDAKKRNYNLHMVVAPTKSLERYEWFLEKATEIGIDEITPIICERSERTVMKLDRLNKIVISAMKQSQQSFLPIVNEPVKLKDFFNLKFEGKKFIAHCLENEKKQLKESLKENEDAVILIGPEGDFSDTEIEQALSLGYIPITLGNTRLRTETAALVACMEANLINR